MPKLHTMCEGGRCLSKMTCYRHTAIPEPFGQLWYVSSPYTDITHCEMYIDNHAYTDNRFGNNNEESDSNASTPDVAGESPSVDGDKTG